MKRFLFLLPAFFLFSCSDEKKEAPAVDSPVKTPASGMVTLLTDSGKLAVQTNGGIKNGDATLYYSDGKIKAKGLFVNDQPAGAWIRYDEKGNVIGAAHLSNGKLLHVLDRNDFDFRTYVAGGMGISFLIPKQWKELKSANPALLVSFDKEVQDTSVRFLPNINIAKAKLQPHDNLQTLANMQIQLLHEQFERVEPVSEENLVIDSCQAFRRFGMYYDGAEKVGFLNAIIVADGEAYFFSCAAQNNADAEFLKYEGVFEQIVNSFHRNR